MPITAAYINWDLHFLKFCFDISLANILKSDWDAIKFAVGKTLIKESMLAIFHKSVQERKEIADQSLVHTFLISPFIFLIVP